MLGTKILLCVLVLIIHAVTAFVVMGVLMIGMNGFDENSGMAGFGVYLLLQIVFMIISVAASYFLFGYFHNTKQLAASSAFAATVAIALVLILIFTVISFIGGLAGASIAWKNR